MSGHQKFKNAKIYRFVKTGLFLQKSSWCEVSIGQFFLNMQKNQYVYKKSILRIRGSLNIPSPLSRVLKLTKSNHVPLRCLYFPDDAVDTIIKFIWRMGKSNGASHLQVLLFWCAESKGNFKWWQTSACRKRSLHVQVGELVSIYLRWCSNSMCFMK